MSGLDHHQRRAVAEIVSQIPASCPADVYDWLRLGYSVEADDRYDDLTVPYPDTSSGARCAMNAAVHEHGVCWCGKFQTGREVTSHASS